MISQSTISEDFEKTLKKEQDSLFPQSEIQILFLNDGVEKSVEAYEANSLPCSEIIEHLNHGESVFISQKKQAKNEPETKSVFDDFLILVSLCLNLIKPGIRTLSSIFNKINVMNGT